MGKVKPFGWLGNAIALLFHFFSDTFLYITLSGNFKVKPLMQQSMIGQILNNRYQITTRLGKGAMRTVYCANDTQSRRDVALKVISSELIVEPEMLERFKREGNASAFGFKRVTGCLL